MPAGVANKSCGECLAMKADEMGVFIEKWYPMILGLVAFSVGACYLWHNPIPVALRDLFSVAVSIGAIAVGFLGTAMSILYTIERRWIVKQLKRAGLFDRLIGYLLHAIWWCLLLAVLSGAGLLLDLKNPANWYSWPVAVWGGVLIGALASCVRVLRLFAMILQTPE